MVIPYLCHILIQAEHSQERSAARVGRGGGGKVADFVDFILFELDVLGEVAVSAEELLILLAVVDVLRHVVHDRMVRWCVHVDFTGVG